MIPHVIHYCWFGGNPIPEKLLRYMDTWKTFCPDYEIKRHDESNFDLTQNLYVSQAAELKKWAFVSDYARLKIILDEGGIYLDTDVEFLRSPEGVLEQGGFLGRQRDGEVTTGVGFAAEPGDPVIQALLKDYEGISFLLSDGTPDLTTCPERIMNRLAEQGVSREDVMDRIGNLKIYPSEYFCPLDFLEKDSRITGNTVSIHHFSCSWQTTPALWNRFRWGTRRILGNKLYDNLSWRIWNLIHGNGWTERPHQKT